MNKRLGMTVCASLTAAGLLLGGCSAAKQVAAQEQSALPVEVTQVQRQTITRTTAYTGRVMPDGAVFVLPKLPGEVTAVHFNVGDKVNQGDILFELDDAIDRLQLKQAESALAAANAGLAQMTGATYEQQLLQLEGQIKQAKSQRRWTDKNYDIFDDAFDAGRSRLDAGIKQLEQAVADAKAAIPAVGEAGYDEAVQAHLELLAQLTELKSQKETFMDGYESQYNQLTQGLEQIEIGLDMAEQAYELAKGPVHEEQLAMIKAQLGQAQAGYEMALEKLSYSKVVSPISGIIQQKNVSVHGFATQSQPAFVISDEGALAITFGVSAEAAMNISVGDPVRVESGSGSYTASVAEVSTMLDQTSGLFKVKAVLSDAPAELMSGVAVKLTATTAKAENAMTIPAGALYYDNGRADRKSVV